MVILIDPPAWPAHGMLWSHLVSDRDYDELHAFAIRLRVPRRSFDIDHYDIPASSHQRALDLGARPVSSKELVRELRNSGLRVRHVDRASVRPIRRRQFLTAQWISLGHAVGAAQGQRKLQEWERLGAHLLGRWNESHRSYHDERHLEDVLLALDQFEAWGEHVSSTTQLAAWFHDAVYTGTGGADELDSARLAVRSLEGRGIAPSVIDAVGELIIATTPTREAERITVPLTHLLDADLSIFAASRRRYDQYASAVRAEYAHVPLADFAAGRVSILNTYLQQSTIYRTAPAQQKWEERARLNLIREIETLSKASSVAL